MFNWLINNWLIDKLIKLDFGGSKFQNKTVFLNCSLCVQSEPIYFSINLIIFKFTNAVANVGVDNMIETDIT